MTILAAVTPLLAGQSTPTIEIDSGIPTGVIAVAAAVVLGAVAYVVARSVLAHRRGESPGRAAAGAARTVGPPLAVAAVSLVALSALAVLAGVAIIVAVFAALSGDPDPLGGLFTVWFLVSLVMVVGLVAALTWCVVRAVRARRRSG